MKTILHTIDTTGPGGAETVFIDLLTCLPKDKYKPIVVIRGKGWVYEELCRRGIKPILINAKGSFNWRYLIGLCKIIYKEDVDIIQSHLFGANVYCSIAGLLMRTPVVATFHGAIDVSKKEKQKWLKFRAINVGANKIVAVSNSLRNELVSKTQLNTKKIIVIYNGIITSNYVRQHSDHMRILNGWSKKDIVVGCLGNIRSPKGYDVLLQAAALLIRERPQYHFLIAGQANSSLYNDLKNLRDELGLQNHVKFIGFYANPAVFLSNLDVFLLPSLSEGFSLATIQAMASGLPVVVTRCGGPEEIIRHNENGLMIEAGSPESIAKALILLSKNKQLWEKLATNARKSAAGTFDLKNMIKQYQKIYDQLL